MPVEFVGGDIFESGADAIVVPVNCVVVPVNCVGVPRKGLALAAAKRWPHWAGLYKAATRRGELRVGHVWASTFPLAPPGSPRHIIAFPTKDHWRNPSRIEWIEEGLCSLRAWAWSRHPSRLAIPALGCGLGELPWAEVRPMIASIMTQADCDVVAFEPHER